MNTKMLSLLAGVAMFGAVGVAQADPVTLAAADLDTVSAGTCSSCWFEKVYLKTYIYSNPYVKDNTAIGEAAAYAEGFNTFTKAVSYTDTTFYSSYSSASSASVTD